MQKRSSKKRPKREDEAQAAVRIMETIAEKTEREPIPPSVSAAAAALGRRGGLKGGPARAAALSPKKRSDIAKKAAAAVAQAETPNDDDDHGLIVSGFGVTARIDLEAATKFIAEETGAVIGDSIRESLKAEADPAAEIEELGLLATACVIDRVPEFWLIVAAKITHALYDTYGDALAAILSDVSNRWPGNPPFTIEQRKQLVQQVKDQIERTKDADKTLRKKPFTFSGMRGGVSGATLLDAPTPAQLSAYARTVQRVKPVWTQIIAMRNSDPEGWRHDADELAERKLDAAAMTAYRDVIAKIPNRAQSLNSARIQPAVCAREHARAILGISARSDSQLKKLAATDNRTA